MTAEIKDIKRQLAELRQFVEVHDLVNKKQAMEILGISSATFTNYICNGRIAVVCRNTTNQPFFSRKQLTGYMKKKTIKTPTPKQSTAVNQQEQEDLQDNGLTDEQKAIAWSEYEHEIMLNERENN